MLNVLKQVSDTKHKHYDMIMISNVCILVDDQQKEIMLCYILQSRFVNL